MATVISNEYDHVDIVNGANTNRHFFKDTAAREDISRINFENLDILARNVEPSDNLAKMLDISYEYEGFTCTCTKENVVTFNGLVSTSYGRTKRLSDIITLPAGTYTLSVTALNEAASSLATRCRILIVDLEYAVKYYAYHGTPATFTLDNEVNIYLAFQTTKNTTYDNASIGVLLVEGGSTDSQTAYYGGYLKDEKAQKNIKDILSLSGIDYVTKFTSGLTIKQNAYVDYTTGTTTNIEIHHPNAISGIPVTGNTMRVALDNCPDAGRRGIAFYDSNGNYIGGRAFIVDQTDYTITVPNGASTVSITTFGIDNIFLVQFSSYDRSKPWSAKKIVCFGDSRTWYDGKVYNENTKQEWSGKTCAGYISTMKDVLGTDNIINCGISGARSPAICDAVRAYDFTGVDAVVLDGDVNDWWRSTPPDDGDLLPIGSVFDTSTVYGAWQSAIEYILTNYPSVTIFVIVSAIAYKANGDVFPYEKARIKSDIANLYKLQCINLYGNLGINKLNRDYYYCDNSGYLHFNDYGNRIYGFKIAQAMNNYSGNDNENVNSFINKNETAMKTVLQRDYKKVYANAISPIQLKNVYGTTQNVHPKVLYFNTPFNGHHYWMAYTPYTNADVSEENPCIAYSDDGYKWTNIEGNPIENVSEDGYYSDTHLVYREDTGIMECWYRLASPDQNLERIYRKTSVDGITWSTQELLKTSTGSKSRILSPVIIWNSTRSIYQIWAVNASGGYHIDYYEATNPAEWTKIREISLSYEDSGNSYYVWHIDVSMIDNKYCLLAMCKNENNNIQWPLFISTSTDNETYTTPTIVILPNDGHWDRDIYRSCIIKTANDYRIYYSARNGGVHGISISVSNELGKFIGYDLIT